jgi:uncharacterized membrane protein YbhN (UPF0104 family)
MRRLGVALVAVGGIALIAIVGQVGVGSIGAALARMTWWQFGLICLVSALGMLLDTIGWRYTLPKTRVPFRRLLAVRCAGEAVNVVTALASVGGEAMKAWLLRHQIPYEESVPSLVLAKTAEVVAQTALLAFAVAIGWMTGGVSSAVLTAIGYMLVVEVLGVGGFLGVQVFGLLGKAGRLADWLGVGGAGQVERMDQTLRGFYRQEWRRFLKATGVYFVGWLLGAVEARLILDSLALPGSLSLATVIAGLDSAVRFATFFVPGSLGVLEGTNAAAFGAFGLGATTGLAFTLVRRARQMVWIALGVLILMAMRPARALARPAEALPEVAKAA